MDRGEVGWERVERGQAKRLAGCDEDWEGCEVPPGSVEGVRFCGTVLQAIVPSYLDLVEG